MNCKTAKPIRNGELTLGETREMRIVIEWTGTTKPTVFEIIVLVDTTKIELLKKAKRELDKLNLQ